MKMMIDGNMFLNFFPLVGWKVFMQHILEYVNIICTFMDKTFVNNYSNISTGSAKSSIPSGPPRKCFENLENDEICVESIQ